MTRPGVKPKPTNLKLIEGVSRKDRINQNEPKPMPVDINSDCPDWLLDDAKEEWKRLAPELKSLGILTRADIVAFAGYCQAYAKWKAAEQFLKKHGTTYKIPKRDKDGKVISIYMAPFPEVAIAKASLEQIRMLAAEFGLTPSSRGRISLPSENDLDQEFEDLINQ
jgi:P27 family predicted phage terminase small subunit